MARAIASLALVAGLLAWSPEADARGCRRVRVVVQVVPPLTSEFARQALLDMLRAKNDLKPDSLGDRLFPEDVVKKIAMMEMHDGKDGSYYWSVFSIHPAKASYGMVIGPSNPEVKACTFFYTGTFQWMNGRWSASVPKLESSALGGGGAFIDIASVKSIKSSRPKKQP